MLQYKRYSVVIYVLIIYGFCLSLNLGGWDLFYFSWKTRDNLLLWTFLRASLDSRIIIQRRDYHTYVIKILRPVYSKRYHHFCISNGLTKYILHETWLKSITDFPRFYLQQPFIIKVNIKTSGFLGRRSVVFSFYILRNYSKSNVLCRPPDLSLLPNTLIQFP